MLLSSFNIINVFISVFMFQTAIKELSGVPLRLDDNGLLHKKRHNVYLGLSKQSRIFKHQKITQLNM